MTNNFLHFSTKKRVKQFKNFAQRVEYETALSIKLQQMVILGSHRIDY